MNKFRKQRSFKMSLKGFFTLSGPVDIKVYCKSIMKTLFSDSKHTKANSHTILQFATELPLMCYSVENPVYFVKIL